MDAEETLAIAPVSCYHSFNSAPRTVARNEYYTVNILKGDALTSFPAY